MHLRESEAQRRIDNREHVVCSRCGAQQEQEPSTLEIGDFRDSVQKNSMFFNFFIKLALHEVCVPQWSAENGDALLERGKTVVSATYTTRLTICIEEKVLAIRRCLSGLVPKACPPTTPRQWRFLLGMKGRKRRPRRREVSQWAAPSLVLPPMLGVAKVRRGRAGINGSPCSPPSPC